jgi:hypothetical protein
VSAVKVKCRQLKLKLINEEKRREKGVFDCYDCKVMMMTGDWKGRE